MVNSVGYTLVPSSVVCARFSSYSDDLDESRDHHKNDGTARKNACAKKVMNVIHRRHQPMFAFHPHTICKKPNDRREVHAIQFNMWWCNVATINAF